MGASQARFPAASPRRSSAADALRPHAAKSADAVAHGSRGPLVGRDSELADLRTVLDRLQQGLPAHALVVGEAGVGKTRLLEELTAEAEDLDIDVLRARADGLSPNEFLGVLLEAVRHGSMRHASLSGEASRLFDAVKLPGGRPAIEAFLDLLEAFTADRPVLLAVDDVQSADAASLTALRSAIRRLTSIPVAVVGTTRAVRGPEIAALQAAVQDADGIIINLAPLDDAAVRILVERRTGTAAGDSLLRRLAAAAGNPLWVCELLDALAFEGLIREEDGVAEVEAAHLPASLQTTILGRLAFLPPGTVDVLKTAALFTRPFRVEWLATLRGQQPGPVISALHEAVDAGVLLEAGDALTFRHDLIREAVYLEVPLALRRAMHREVARVLRDAGAPASRIAAHLSLGAHQGDQEAVEWLWETGKEAKTRAPAEAAEYLRKAYALSTPTDARRADVLVDLLDALVLGGRPEEAADLARRVLPAFGQTDVAVDILVGLGRALLFLQQPGEADAATAFDDAVGRIDPGDPRRARLLAESAYVRNLVDPTRARRLAEDALAASHDAGDRAAEGLALFVIACVDVYERRVGEAIEGFRAAVDIAERWRPPELLHRAPHLYLAWQLQEAGEVEEAAIHVRTFAAHQEELYSPWSLVLQHAVPAIRLFDVGEWNDAVTELLSLLSVVEEMGARWGHDTAHAFLAVIAHDQGRDDAAQTHTRAIPSTSRLWAAPVAVLVESASDPNAALRRLESLVELDALHPVCARIFFPRLVRFSVMQGAKDDALRFVEHMEESARRARVRPADAAALNVRALVDGDVDGLLEAVAMYRETPRVVERAAALHDAAVALGRTGRRKQALELFQEADDIYRQLGAVRPATLLRSELRRAGLVRSAKPRTKRPPVGWESLTKTERSVLGHLADGLTNREIAERLFVSRRTVDTHVAHILRKLELRSRAQVAAAVARRYSDGRPFIAE